MIDEVDNGNAVTQTDEKQPDILMILTYLIGCCTVYSVVQTFVNWFDPEYICGLGIAPFKMFLVFFVVSIIRIVCFIIRKNRGIDRKNGYSQLRGRLHFLCLVLFIVGMFTAGIFVR